MSVILRLERLERVLYRPRLFRRTPGYIAMQNGEQPATSGDADELWLTYAALATRLGISHEAARQLVRRRKWRRVPPNRQGAPTTVVVPVVELSTETWRLDRPVPPDTQEASPGVPLNDYPATPADRLVETAQPPGQPWEISRLVDLLTAALERADTADADRHTAEARAERAEATVAGERARADSLRDRLDSLTGELREAQEAAQVLRQAELARQARGLLARLRDAWRGE
jgi:hypothetical protein